MLVSLLAFPITACGQNRAWETGTAPVDTGSEPEAEEEIGQAIREAIDEGMSSLWKREKSVPSGCQTGMWRN